MYTAAVICSGGVYTDILTGTTGIVRRGRII